MGLITDFSWQYLAGLFDGEGWVTCPMNKGYPSLRVYIAQSGNLGLRLFSEIKDWLEKQYIVAKIYPGTKNGLTKLDPYRLVIAQKESAYRFLQGVRPYLHVKQEQVCRALWKREVFWLKRETARPVEVSTQ